MLEDLLSAVPDTLTVDEVAELIGYNRKTILRYVQRKYIYGVNMMGKYYISKHSTLVSECRLSEYLHKIDEQAREQLNIYQVRGVEKSL